MEVFAMLSFIYDSARLAVRFLFNWSPRLYPTILQMTTDASSTQKGSGNITPSPKLLSPAEAIAEAWRRETEESKARWRRIDEDVRRHYTNPHRKKERRTKL
ncbi:hypothetical protein DFS33DRAFT_105360 [Desarmillaria ectypa]|nr:hypothetical protein DFS33DRAFT_105360 [Desarmillaria ectypa]